VATATKPFPNPDISKKYKMGDIKNIQKIIIHGFRNLTSWLSVFFKHRAPSFQLCAHYSMKARCHCTLPDMLSFSNKFAPRARIDLRWNLGHQFNKRLESFALCYSQFLLLADFKENSSLC
jgi:hypothetical protein